MGKSGGRVGHLVRGLATLCCGSGYGNGSEEVSPCHWGRRVAGCVVEIIVANLIPPSCPIQKIQRVPKYPSLRNWVVRGEIEQKTSKTTKSLLSFGRGKIQRICNKQKLNLWILKFIKQVLMLPSIWWKCLFADIWLGFVLECSFVALLINKKYIVYSKQCKKNIGLLQFFSLPQSL